MLLFLVQIFLTTAFFPYQVVRPVRRPSYCTYSLMGINTVIFLLTVLIANINLPSDRYEGHRPDAGAGRPEPPEW
jgi:hypothetical protein